MREDRNSGIVSVGCDVDVVHGCHQILVAVNVLVVNLEFVAERVGGDAKAAVDDSRASLDKITEVARAIQRMYERNSDPIPRSLAASKT